MMRKVWMLSLLLLAARVEAQPRISSAFIPASSCVDGVPWQVFVLDATDISDCDDTPSGTAEALCLCQDGVIAPPASGGGGAPTTLDYFVGTATGSLSAERVGTDTPTVDVDLTTAGQVKFNVITPVLSATSLAANPTDCALSDGTEFAWRIASSGDLSCVPVQQNYDQFDPNNPPASSGTGGCSEEWTNDTAACSWSWMNQDAATETISLDSSLVTGEVTADEIRGRFAAAATNADQTFCAKMLFVSAGTGSACFIGEISAGTVATPTALEFFGPGDFATDNISSVADTNIDPSAGATVHATISLWSLLEFSTTPLYLQIRYIDSSRATGFWYSWDGISWIQLGTNITLAADPLFWGFGARDAGACRFYFVRLRTDADRDKCGE